MTSKESLNWIIVFSVFCGALLVCAIANAVLGRWEMVLTFSAIAGWNFSCVLRERRKLLRESCDN